MKGNNDGNELSLKSVVLMIVHDALFLNKDFDPKPDERNDDDKELSSFSIRHLAKSIPSFCNKSGISTVSRSRSVYFLLS